MRCPYCVSEIADEALVCPRCTRDLYLFKPLLEKVDRLEKAVAEQAAAAAGNAEARIAALEQELAAIKAGQGQPMQVEIVGEMPGAAEAAEAQAQPADPAAERWAFAKGLGQALVPALVLLLLAHWLMLFVYDTKPLYLRVATLIIPIPFGFLLAAQHRGFFWPGTAAGFGAAVVAVLGMLTVTAAIDKVPVLPQDARDFRETLEYVAAIGLAFTTGIMLGEWLPAFREKGSHPHRVMLLVARAVTPDEEGKLGIEKAAKKIDKLMKAAAPAATGAASVYAGVKAFLGQLG